MNLFLLVSQKSSKKNFRMSNSKHFLSIDFVTNSILAWLKRRCIYTANGRRQRGLEWCYARLFGSTKSLLFVCFLLVLCSIQFLLLSVTRISRILFYFIISANFAPFTESLGFCVIHFFPSKFSIFCFWGTPIYLSRCVNGIVLRYLWKRF